MDIHFELNGTAFVWNSVKAARNPVNHDGITFDQAATVFFDPFLCLVDAIVTMRRVMPLSVMTL